MELYSSLIIAMFVTMALIPPLIQSAVKLKFVDVPNERKVHQTVIPRVGGIAMFVGAVLPILLWLSTIEPIGALLLAFLIIITFGVWDDRCDLDYRIKFFGQLLAIIVVVVFGGVRIEIIPFSDATPVPSAISIPLTIFFLLGITNAINLSDGLDGLAGGITLITLSIIAVMAYSVGDSVVVIISFAVIGSILGFLRFNTHPAKVFMGDGGSQFLGFTSGVLAVLLTQNPETPLSAALPILLLGLPIFDTLLVMGQRIREGRSPFSADKNHIHHRLLDMGLDHYSAVTVIYVVQVGLVLLAYYLRYESDYLILTVYTAICFVLAGLVYKARETNFRFDSISSKNKKVTSYNSNTELSNKKELIRSVCLSTLSLAIIIFFLWSVINVSKVSIDLGLICLVIMGLLSITAFRSRNKPITLFERASIYLICTYIVYINHTNSFSHIVTVGEMMWFYGVLALLVFLVLYCSTDKQFEITTHDYIVIFLAFIIPSLPESFFSHEPVGDIVAKLIVLYYGIELMLAFVNKQKNNLRIVTILLFGILGFQSFF